jgi:hypothetical protein
MKSENMTVGEDKPTSYDAAPVGEASAQKSLAEVISELDVARIVRESGTSSPVVDVRNRLSRLVQKANQYHDSITAGRYPNSPAGNYIAIEHGTGRARRKIIELAAQALGDNGEIDPALTNVYTLTNVYKEQGSNKPTSKFEFRRLPDGKPINDPDGHHQWIAAVQIQTNLSTSERRGTTAGIMLEPEQSLTSLVLLKVALPNVSATPPVAPAKAA